MLTISLWLGGTALVVGTIAVSLAAFLDIRDRDHRARQSRTIGHRAPHTKPLTATLWNLTSSESGQMLVDDMTSATRTCPDIIVGPWEATPVSIDEQPRKAA